MTRVRLALAKNPLVVETWNELAELAAALEDFESENQQKTHELRIVSCTHKRIIVGATKLVHRWEMLP